MVVESTVVHEDIGASVNKNLQLGCITFHVTTPSVVVENPSIDVLPLHELQRSRGIFFAHFLLQLCRRRKQEDQRPNHSSHNAGVKPWFVQFPLVGRKQLQTWREYRDQDQAREEQEPLMR